MIRVALAHRIDDFHLGLGVDLRDEIVLPLLADIETVHAVHAADDDFSGTTGGADGNIEQRLHGKTTSTNEPRIQSGSGQGAGIGKEHDGGVPSEGALE
ncbi:hypothetical protein GCM10011488_23760 [Steroidobacter agaridevorans]|nr:hypothetical protein GCM10011488_23760 [Steroidobacter agaridevorans]